MSKGIGFNKKAGDIIDKNIEVEKIFLIESEKSQYNLQSLYNNIDEEFIMIFKDIISEIHGELGEEFNESIHISLISHLSQIIKYRYLFAKIIRYIESVFNANINKKSLHYARFLSHISFTIERLLTNAMLNNDLIDIIKSSYPESYEVSKKIANIIEESLNKNIIEDEVAYIAMHIERIRITLNKK